MGWLKKKAVTPADSAVTPQTPTVPQLAAVPERKTPRCLANSVLIPMWQLTEKNISEYRNAARESGRKHHIALNPSEDYVLYDLPPEKLGLPHSWLTPPIRAREWVTYIDYLIPKGQTIAFWGVSVESSDPCVSALEFYMDDPQRIEYLQLEKLYSWAPAIRPLLDKPELAHSLAPALRAEGVTQSPMIFGAGVRVIVKVLGRRDNPDGEHICLYTLAWEGSGWYLAP